MPHNVLALQEEDPFWVYRLIVGLINYCTDRLLLQRIDDRDRFMHKTFQDYFANLELRI